MPPSGEALGEIEHRPHLYQYWATMGRGMIQLVSVVARASRVRPLYAGVAVTAAVTCLSMSAFGGTPRGVVEVSPAEDLNVRSVQGRRPTSV